MKIRSIACTIIMMIMAVAVACNDDDEQKPSIVGKWQGDKIDFSIATTGIPVPFTTTEDDFDTTIEFKTDGTVILINDGISTSGTYEVKNDRLITNIEFNTSINDLAGEYTIQELTETKLTIFIQEDNTVQDPNSGINITGSVKATLFFDRI